MQNIKANEITRASHFFSGPTHFIHSIASITQLAEASFPEVSVSGRSNVGKSSLINALFGRKLLAHTSNTPGRTQCLNYFNLRDQLFIVDMPGYGYAQAPKDIVANWHKLIDAYLAGRVSLRMVLVLIDSRRSVGKQDQILMDKLNRWGIAFQLVVTKIDKLPEVQRPLLTESLRQVLLKHPAGAPEPILTSAHKNEGINILRNNILERLDF